jgi:ABC-type multidrug transport system ATPase subunit
MTRACAAPGAPLAQAVNVTRRFGRFTAVDQVSMSIHPGEIVGLLGANGAGKTTLIRMMLGLVLPATGTVALFGRPPGRETRTRLGYVPQGLGLWSDLTVTENLRFVAHAYRHRPATETGELAEAATSLAGDISLGLQRQLAFTAALGHHPELLILDEPTSGADPLSRARLWDTIHSQAEQGTGILVTTHYMQEAQQCDRLILMSHGRQAAAGTEEDIIGETTAVEVDTTDWAAAFAALGSTGLPVTLAGRTVRIAGTPPGQVGDALATAGIHAEVRQVPATLEEKMVIIERASLRLSSGGRLLIACARRTGAEHSGRFSLSCRNRPCCTSGGCCSCSGR